MIVDDGKNRIKDLIDADLYQGQWGTGTTPALATDTSVEDGVASTLLSVTKSITDKQIIIDHNITKGTAVGEVMGNYGITMNTGTDFFQHINITPITKNSSVQWQTTVIFNII